MTLGGLSLLGTGMGEFGYPVQYKKISHTREIEWIINKSIKGLEKYKDSKETNSLPS